jgi:hypothetical protein
MEDDGVPKKVRLLASFSPALKLNVDFVIQSNIMIRADEILSRYSVAKTHTLGDTLHQSSHSVTHPSSSTNMID